MKIKICLRHAAVLFVLFALVTQGYGKDTPPPPPPPPPPPTWQDNLKQGVDNLKQKVDETKAWCNEHEPEIKAAAKVIATDGAATAVGLLLAPEDARGQFLQDAAYYTAEGLRQECAKARREKELERDREQSRKRAREKENIENIIRIICAVPVAIVGLLFGILLIMALAKWLWKLIKDLSRRLWKKKLHIPSLRPAIFKLPWLLQVKKFRRPDIWASNIPRGLLIIDIVLWLCDLSLCVLCLCYGLCFLFLLVPMLILTYYLYVGVYWARIVIVALLAMACLVCGMCFGEGCLYSMCFVSACLIALLWLPKSNAWFRAQNTVEHHNEP